LLYYSKNVYENILQSLIYIYSIFLFMIFREAEINDIPQMHEVRIAVKENILPDPDLISKSDYEDLLLNRGKVGFAK